MEGRGREGSQARQNIELEEGRHRRPRKEAARPKPGNRSIRTAKDRGKVNANGGRREEKASGDR